MDTQEAYHELGLDPTATDAQLKTAWRRLVAAWHPDRNTATDALQRMQAINKAYQHIRQVRDGGGEGEEAPPNAGPSPAPEPAAETQSKAEPEPEAESTHPPQVHTVRLGLEDALLGCTRSLRGHFTHTCTTCVGTGQRVLAQACGTCRGSGAIRKPTLFGWLWNEEGCADCGGDGRQRAACDACHSTGEVQVAYHRRVRLPSGMRHGDVLAVPPSRQGGADTGLELRVEVAPHPFFTLDEQGVLRCDMPVNGYAWMTGRWVEVPTPDGLQQMRLNRDALVYRLGGKGFPATHNGPRGDFIVKVQPVFPPQDDPEQEALWAQLIEASNRQAAADPTQPLGDWQQRLKAWKAG